MSRCPEPSVLVSTNAHHRCCCGWARLLEYAYNYYDPKSFKDGETKRCLERILKKKSGPGGKTSSTGEDGRERKKRKKDKK